MRTPQTTDAEREAILERFAQELLGNMRDLEPDIAHALNENFWELFEPFEEAEN